MILNVYAVATMMLSCVLAAQQQPPSSRAKELGLTQTWIAPMNATKGADISQFMSENWGVVNHNFYGKEDVSFTSSDPVGGSSSSSSNTTDDSGIIEVQYKAGSYAAKDDGAIGGCEFNAYPFGESASFDSALLSYQVAFDDGFDWVQGGKLPGIFGGGDDEKCSGGDKADGSNCFSLRLMWREDGEGEAYAYIPDDEICDSKQNNVTCIDGFGISFSRGAIKFNTNEWTKMEIYVKMNDASDSNGELKVWQDDSLLIDASNIKYRTTDQLGVSSLMFSTFFGGGSKEYASSTDTSTYYKNIEFSVGK
ncbi:polysaccharide lyase family 14 protein [Lichtheimia corymbifera JMRC:FSU:9682]|uniref:Polysaccharide lyase family 14 protein n=1 Tax=Lichtheimia corymbifera JMRC:FSU:9682 TaxID=1263082 RepID=A0A068RHW7_9FUNG|nr:polysaccharide lyase family 14 protein [Lichtheimia corymbifera JMRC:FSU:9682]